MLAGHLVDEVPTFAKPRQVTQVVVGESLRPRWRELVHGWFVNRLIRGAANVDIHVIVRGGPLTRPAGVESTHFP